MPSIYAALWSRPSTGLPVNAGRTVAQGFAQLSKAMGLAVKRMDEAWQKLPQTERQPKLKGVFVAPEYYFANPQMGKWDATAGNFRSRPIEQDAKEALLVDLIALSERHPSYVIVPGSVAWRKPLDRTFFEEVKKTLKTVARTGSLTTVDRRTKVAGIVGAAGANWGMGGERMVPDNFSQAVLDAINGLSKGNPATPCPWDLKGWFDDKKAGGMTGQEAFDEIVKDVKWDSDVSDFCAWAGLPPVAVIPKKSEKVAAITSGTATHLMRNTAFVLHDGKVVFKYNKRGDFHECIGDGKTVFAPGEGLGKTNPICGVTFGLEICLDHALGVLHTGVGGAGLPDIHIIISDDVENDTANMKAKNYCLHASTDKEYSGVWAAPAWTPADDARLPDKDLVDGGKVKYWKLKI